MIVILKPLFELLTGDIVICNNIIFNYISLLLIGKLAYRFAKNLVGTAYHSDLIEGSIIGSILHWTLRFFFYIGAAYFIKFCIWMYQFICAIPFWVWGVTTGSIGFIFFLSFLLKASKYFKRKFVLSKVNPNKDAFISFSPEQMEQICLGKETGLSERQVNFYAKPDIDYWEMCDLREKLFYIPDVPFLIEKYRPEVISAGQARYSGWIATMGGICGDIAGSRYEFNDCDRSKVTFETAISPHSRFTDDTILMMATLDAVGKPETDRGLRQLMNAYVNNFTEEALPFGETEYTQSYKKYFKLFPNGGYGPGFYQWGFTGEGPYRSYGNGSAMRVAPIGEAFDSVEDVILHATASAACTHNHPEGIKGAVVTAVCIWMGRHCCSKEDILIYVKKHYDNQDLIRKYTMEEVHSCKQGGYAVACQFAIPAAISCFVESCSYEECISNALSFEGDSDTIAAIAGAIAASYYGNVPDLVNKIIVEKLPQSLLSLFDLSVQPHI